MSWRAQFGQLARTIDTVFPGDKDLEALFALGRPLRVKYGLDITSPEVTIGNEIGLRVLGRFQELGHHAVIILGDFTTRVGDPSGRDKTRPTLTADQIRANGAGWLDQIRNRHPPAHDSDLDELSELVLAVLAGTDQQVDAVLDDERRHQVLRCTPLSCRFDHPNL